MIALQHPRVSNRKSYAAVIWLSAAFIFGCGLTHLLGAYTTLNPVYELQGWVLIVNGLISVAAMFFIVFGLIRSVESSKETNKQINQKLKKLVDRYKDKK